MVDPESLQLIADALELTACDTVIEVGPGIGFLTQYLHRQGALVKAVELDYECVAALEEMGMDNLTISHGDFLRFDLTQYGKIKVAGNVPYQITTPILCYLFGEIGEPKPWFHLIERVVMTVQVEVAERFAAKPGSRNYSQITLLSNYFSKAEILHILPPGHFYPAPKVTSAVVMFTPLAAPPIQCSNTKLLRQVIKAGFSSRRKMLRNNLAFLRLPDSDIARIFSELNLDPQARAENLSLATFGKLTDKLELLKSSNN